MGSWEAKCELSGLGISAGTEVVAIPVVRGPKYENSYIDMNSNWFPVDIHVFGAYDDYGGVNLHDGERQRLQGLMDRSDEVIKEVPFEIRNRVRENLRGLEYKNGIEGDEYDYGSTSTLGQKIERHNKPFEVRFPRWMFIRRDVFDYLLGANDDVDKKFIEDAKNEEREWRKENPALKLLGRMDAGLCHVIRNAGIEDYRSFIEYHDLDRIGEFIGLYIGMQRIHASWMVTHTGPQCHDNVDLINFYKFVCQLTK